MKIGASGVVREGSGIGVLQRALYPRLETRGFKIIASQNRDLGPGLISKAVGLVRGLNPAKGQYESYFSVVPPLPLGLRGPVVSVVHDLRRRQTRGGFARRYRQWDLRRTVSRSRIIICVSERTKADLVSHLPGAGSKARVAWLGPGLFDVAETGVSKVPGSVLLVGGAAHKRNELAADVIAHLPRDKFSSVIGVGVGETAKRILENSLGADSCTWLERISDEEMRDAYRKAEYFMLLGTDEGFGLPYIEALAAQCTVIAADQVLTQEILGRAGILTTLADASVMADQISESTKPQADDVADVIARYSWDSFAEIVIDSLRAATGAQA